MQKYLSLAALALFTASSAVAAERRELGAHQHGHGTLNIAVDGNKISMELEAPGADIAGFEHEAKSDKDKAAIKSATEKLEKPLALFKVPDAAKCSVSEATVKLEAEEHDHEGHDKDHHEDHDKAEKAKHDDDHDHDHDKDGAEAQHSEFHAEYLLECGSPAEFKSLGLDYFVAFKSAEGLTIEVITPKGQSKFEATRDKPVIDLSSLL